MSSSAYTAWQLSGAASRSSAATSRPLTVNSTPASTRSNQSVSSRASAWLIVGTGPTSGSKSIAPFRGLVPSGANRWLSTRGYELTCSRLCRVRSTASVSPWASSTSTAKRGPPPCSCRNRSISTFCTASGRRASSQVDSVTLPKPAARLSAASRLTGLKTRASRRVIGATRTKRLSPAWRYQPSSRIARRKSAWPCSPIPGWSRPIWLNCWRETRKRVSGRDRNARSPRCSNCAHMARSPIQSMARPLSIIRRSQICSSASRRAIRQLGSPMKLMVWSARNETSSRPSIRTSPANGKQVARMSGSGCPSSSIRNRRDEARTTFGSRSIAPTNASTHSGSNTSSSWRNLTYSPSARRMPFAVLPSSPRRVSLRK